MKATEIRNKNLSDLEKDVSELLEEQFKLRMQSATGQTVRPHRFKELRREIARFNTVIHEKKGE